ncbi:uncharacterized protein LOC116922192 [Daphnia magna]|uniref:Uncharacterized protein n=1 Tax=Daphnia magna TaxID=35525 RepID=A0A0P5XJ49_9CRUS|nr:uncharacterized protein LOC116922192 [Daphnia magna]KZS14784.1 Uncharacterized protein APZ42_020191 [Daphnia magna]
MRITPRRLVYSGLFALGMLCLIKYINYRRGESAQPECLNRRPDDQLRVIFLAERVHRALEILQVQHFICYESLWASLYNEGPRMWENVVEMCLIDDTLAQQDEAFIARFFRTQDLILDYDMLEGVYVVKLMDKVNFPGLPNAVGPDVSARLILFLQRSEFMMMRKAGLKRALLPDDCENPLLECFPSQLALPPLSRIKYGPNQYFPAPREGIEIQKYHYPDDWWLQRKIPSLC